MEEYSRLSVLKDSDFSMEFCVMADLTRAFSRTLGALVVVTLHMEEQRTQGDRLLDEGQNLPE